MKTIVIIEHRETRIELIPENEFEQNLVNDFDFSQHDHSFSKEDKKHNQYAYDKDKKIVIEFSKRQRLSKPATIG